MTRGDSNQSSKKTHFECHSFRKSVRRLTELYPVKARDTQYGWTDSEATILYSHRRQSNRLSSCDTETNLRFSFLEIKCCKQHALRTSKFIRVSTTISSTEETFRKHLFTYALPSKHGVGIEMHQLGPPYTFSLFNNMNSRHHRLCAQHGINLSAT